MRIRIVLFLAALTVASGLALAPLAADCCGDPVFTCPPICGGK